MLSVATKGVLDPSNVAATPVAGVEEKLDCVNQSSRMTFQRQLDENEEDFLDDNDMERILSRLAIPRRKLDLFDAPEFVQRLSSYHEATEGDMVTFSGQYKAFPKPTVKWFKDEEEITETKRHRLDLSSEFNGIARLIIQDVIKQDEGAYKCKVENQEGVASTTGYLSVSGKSSNKNNSLQTKKLAQDRVSTPPYLRPIAEQKSMEEREEKEYQCLPPSPLQEFMDKIRHCAKSMQGPIVYADMSDLYSDDDIIKDFDDDADVDVFDEENISSTPSGSPTEEKSFEDELYRPHETSPTRDYQPTPTSSNIHVIDVFVSPSVDLSAATITTQTSNEDSALDNQDNQNNRTVDAAGELDKRDGPHTNLRNRRIKLALQRSLAVEIPESDAYATPSTSSGSNEPRSPETKDECKKTCDAETPIEVSRRTELSMEFQQKPSNIHTDTVSRSTEPSESLLDILFRWIDSPWIQLFLGFILSAASISLLADIPTTHLIAAVALLSIIFFQILESRQQTG